MHRLWRLIVISRPLLYIPSLTAFLAGIPAGQLVTTGSLLGAIFVTFPMGLIVYGLNDIADRKSDAQNPRKGSIDGARLRKAEDRTVVTAIIAIAAAFLLLSIALRLVGLSALIAIVCVFAYLYSFKPARLKSRPVLDSLSNGVWIASIFAAGFWANVHTFPLHIPPFFIAVGLFGAALHALGAVVDYEVDKAVGDTTICVALGKIKTLLLCCVAFLLCVPSAIDKGAVIVWYLLLVSGLTASLLFHPSSRRVRAMSIVIVLLLPPAIVLNVWLVGWGG